MARYNYKKFASMTPEEIGKLKVPEMKNLLVQARGMYQKRSAVMDKQGRYFYSPAYDVMQEFYEENPMKNIDELTRNRAMAEVFMIQNFFQSKTGSVSGAREVMKEQDSRIFGVNSRSGRPLHKMTKNQRKNYWDVYREFTHQFKNSLAKYGSTLIQQFLGERVVEGRGEEMGIDMNTLNSISTGLSHRRREESSDDTPNVYTGRGRNNRNS